MWFSRYPLPKRRGRLWNNHVEINVAEHCNLSCRSCSHQSPVMPRRYVDPARVYADLRKLSATYGADQVSLLGGEPLLHPDLLSVIDAARRSGVSDGVRIVTNGVLLPRMSEECWKALDEVRVSVYPGHELSAEEREHCRTMAAWHDVRLVYDRMDRFFESYAALGTNDDKLVRDVYATCVVAHAWRCHLVQDGWFYKCPHAYFLAKSLRLRGAEVPVDAIEIADDRGFARRLATYLRSPEPLDACRVCVGTVGKQFQHEQVARRDWAAPQQKALEEMIDPEVLASAKRYI